MSEIDLNTALPLGWEPFTSPVQLCELFNGRKILTEDILSLLVIRNFSELSKYVLTSKFNELLLNQAF